MLKRPKKVRKNSWASTNIAVQFKNPCLTPIILPNDNQKQRIIPENRLTKHKTIIRSAPKIIQKQKKRETCGF
jgi:hypothetical protein